MEILLILWLEDELNDLSDAIGGGGGGVKKISKNFKSDFFGSSSASANAGSGGGGGGGGIKLSSYNDDIICNNKQTRISYFYL